ncbi:MAG: VWA domain-containing protein [Chloroflexota bacterium]|nr:VWA domain-containing protein [Chloroflexota bacterium]
MTFAHPQFLIALLLVPLAGLFLAWASGRRKQALAALGNPSLIERLSSNVNWRGRRWRTALWLIALTLLIVSIARPQWGAEVREVKQEGLQVIVALDVSQSMLAEDVKPNRLDRAKQEIADLTERLEGDEIGLVLFSGASFLQVPLTSDYNTALNYLDSAGPKLISRPGTVIGDAIRTAMRAFDDKLDSQKVLVVMTDGEDVETDPIVAAQEATDANILIYTIGFGTPEGEPVPETDRNGRVIGYRTDAQGNVALSSLDESTLQAVASTGNGKYYRATASGQELDALLAEIDGLQHAQLESRLETRYIERYQIFLALALLALVAGELIPDRRRDKSRAAMTGHATSTTGATAAPQTG